MHSLTGDIPSKLGRLSNLDELRLSGNQLMGCIPLALQDLATNDLSSLNLLYCAPAPENLSAGTPGETSIQLDPDISEEAVAEVFVRINSQGKTLNQADFILTLMSVFWDEGRTDLERFSRLSMAPSANGPSPYNHFIQPSPDQLLRVSVGLGFKRGRLQHVLTRPIGRLVRPSWTTC